MRRFQKLIADHGGMISSKLLTLLVIPAIYALVKSRQSSPKKGAVRYRELKPAE